MIQALWAPEENGGQEVDGSSTPCRKGRAEKVWRSWHSWARALRRRREDVQAYLRHRSVQMNRSRPSMAGSSIYGGTALGLCNLEHYIVRCLIHSGQLHTRINALQNTKSS